MAEMIGKLKCAQPSTASFPCDSQRTKLYRIPAVGLASFSHCLGFEGHLQVVDKWMQGTKVVSLTAVSLCDKFPAMLTQRIKIHGGPSDEAALEIASNAILSGNVISVPTDTFYALAADPFNLMAVEQIFQIKGRKGWKPLLLLIDSVEQAENVATDIPDLFYKIAEQFWPGPLTLILPAANNVPFKVTGGTGTVGVRIPDLTLTRLLVRALDLPIVGTSANLSAHPPCATADGVLQQLGGKIELILDQGALSGNAPSTILDLTQQPPRLVREGAIPAQDLSQYFSP
jgi:L-threonylcarbamoyladenylate synthase